MIESDDDDDDGDDGDDNDDDNDLNGAAATRERPIEPARDAAAPPTAAAAAAATAADSVVLGVTTVRKHFPGFGWHVGTVVARVGGPRDEPRYSRNHRPAILST